MTKQELLRTAERVGIIAAEISCEGHAGWPVELDWIAGDLRKHAETLPDPTRP
jgi:hypothetical protein